METVLNYQNHRRTKRKTKFSKVRTQSKVRLLINISMISNIRVNCNWRPCLCLIFDIIVASMSSTDQFRLVSGLYLYVSAALFSGLLRKDLVNVDNVK